MSQLEELDKVLEDAENELNTVSDLQTLQQKKANYLGKKGLEVEKELRSGGVFTEIIKAAEEYDADLILLGGTEKDAARTDYRKPVLSRDQNEVLANSKCPVLIVQKEGIEAEFKIF